MLGAASQSLAGIDPAVWREAIGKVVRPKALGVNLQAFEAGAAL
jgi:Pyruvate/2-oxoacid:ferredoxin oxidoreductase gamma subunit